HSHALAGSLFLVREKCATIKFRFEQSVLLGAFFVDDCSGVATATELLRRLIVEAAMRSNRVVLPSPPVRLALRIRHRYELVAIQKLIPQPTMKRFDVTVLPRTRRRHLDRLGALLWQPTGQ